MAETETVSNDGPNTTNRPLSPHLTIYKPQITSVLSITHRATGAYLSLGFVFFVAWIWANAYWPNCAATLSYYASSTCGHALIMTWVAAFFYHFMNGIRHLFWDMGKGLSNEAANRSGWITIVGTLVLTGLTCYLAFGNGVMP